MLGQRVETDGSLQVGFEAWQGQAWPVTTGLSWAQPHDGAVAAGFWLHGQAAIAFANEHVVIPTAIAAATVSFLIVILTSFF